MSFLLIMYVRPNPAFSDGLELVVHNTYFTARVLPLSRTAESSISRWSSKYLRDAAAAAAAAAARRKAAATAARAEDDAADDDGDGGGGGSVSPSRNAHGWQHGQADL